ncbi:MAG TPA: hypothetical protein DDW50_15135 [Firmicutes bacterium]|jgi:hypothetical protein|nr:hypothetical protein [Bacillota bacterium]
MNVEDTFHIIKYEAFHKKAGTIKGVKKMAENPIQGLVDGIGGFFNNGWLMFLIFVLLVIGCGGCFGGGGCW